LTKLGRDCQSGGAEGLDRAERTGKGPSLDRARLIKVTEKISQQRGLD
jgi:hypothetical protein